MFFGMTMARKQATNQKLKMKKKIRNITIVFGAIVAFVALSNSESFAGKTEQQKTKLNIPFDTEMLDQVEELLKVEEVAKPCDKRIKIFNSERQLIYECRGDDDQRLALLLRRSDLMFQTDSSSYYLLGD
jgi:hypothetical protein